VSSLRPGGKDLGLLVSMATLRWFDRFGDIRFWGRNADRLEPGAVASGWHDVDGVFVGTDDRWIAIVRDGDLFVARPGEQRPVADIELVEVVPTKRRAREVCLKLRDGCVWVAEYEALGPELGEVDPTPFVESDDFGFGGYVGAFVLDPERWGRLFRRER